MSKPELEPRPSYPRTRPPRANERSARLFAPLDDERPPLSASDVPSSPLSAVSFAGSWSGSSNTQEQFTPRTPDFCFPPVAAAAIATSGELTVSTEDKTMISSLSTTKETSPATIVHSKLPHRVDSLVRSVPIDAQHGTDQHPVAFTREACRPPDLSTPPENTLTQLSPAARRRKVQQVPQKHVSWSSAIVSDSPSIPLDLDKRIPPVAPLSKDEVKKVQSFLRELREFDDLQNRPTQQERSPALRRDKTPLSSPKKGKDGVSDEFSWEPRNSTFVDSDELADPTRCSLLIQEVSLMVGLTPDNDQPMLDDGSLPKSPPLPNVLGHSGHRTTGDSLGLSPGIPPAESLALRRRENASLPSSRQIDRQAYPLEVPISHDEKPRVKNANANIHSDYPFLKETSPPVRPRGLTTPIPRHKSADAIHLSAQSRRRHGQVFQFDRLTNDTPPVSHVNVNGPPVHARELVSKPLPNVPPNRLSSLNRLECSLEKLKAHAPANHHKSRSEGTSPSYLGRKERPAVLRKQQSNYEVSRPKAPRPVCGRHFSNPMPPVSGSPPAYPYIAEPTCPPSPSEDEHLSTPGSFMDMDIPPTLKVPQKKRVSFRHTTNNEKMKHLVQTAKRVSRRVITWGKNLAGPSKPTINGVKATPIQSSYI